MWDSLLSAQGSRYSPRYASVILTTIGVHVFWFSLFFFALLVLMGTWSRNVARVFEVEEEGDARGISWRNGDLKV